MKGEGKMKSMIIAAGLTVAFFGAAMGVNAQISKNGETYVIEPRPTATVDSGEDAAETARGPMKVAWHKDPGRFVLDVDVPNGIEAVVRMPDGTERKTTGRRRFLCPMAEYPDTRIPPPEKVSSDYYLACHYYPGWNIETNGYSDFKCILDHPDRKPLIGWYDESLPEVADWQVKWALEHGINCFIFCWYRTRANEGKPVTFDALHKAHQLPAFEKSNYAKMMDFAIMWECNVGTVTDERDLLDNLVPYWVEHYFRKPNYLKFGNKPVLFVYECNFKLLTRLGSPEKVRHALVAASEKVREYGFDGIHYMAENRTTDTKQLDTLKQCGYSEAFAYCWWNHRPETMTQEDSMSFQLANNRTRLAYDPKFIVLTASQSWDPFPWWGRNGEDPDTMWRWKLEPSNWRKVLEEVKKLADSMPADAVGRRFIMLDNWNEWCEGHYIAPHRSGGFKYLQAVREVFTKRDNLPDYRLPHDLGLGPYDKGIDWAADKPKSK